MTTVAPTKEHITQTIRAGGAYSTEETALHGKLWIDGKQIYRKIVDCGTLPNNTTTTVNHSISSPEVFTKIKIVTDSTTSATRFNFPYSTSGKAGGTLHNVEVYCNATQIWIGTTGNYSAHTGHAVLEYTKA